LNIWIESGRQGTYTEFWLGNIHLEDKDNIKIFVRMGDGWNWLLRIMSNGGVWLNLQDSKKQSKMCLHLPCESSNLPFFFRLY
jgi:hypothetical protein